MSYFRIDESNMFDAADQYNSISNNMAGTHDAMNGSFNGMRSAGLAPGFSEIHGQVGSLATSINQLSKMVNEQTNNVIGVDTHGAKKVEQILVPQDFVANNAMKINEFDKSILEKIDGKHVDSSEAEAKAELDNSSVIGKIQTLDDVTKGATEAQTYDSNVSIAREQELANITNEEELEEQKIDDSTNIAGQEELVNINNQEGLEEQNIDNNTVIQDVGLGDVSNNEVVAKQELDASYKDIEDASIQAAGPSEERK